MTFANYGITAPSWMRGTPLEAIYLQRWIETGDTGLALEAVRQAPAYDEVFAGNRREDGSLRYDENTYLGIVENYEDTLLSINVNPDLFASKFPDLLAGLVSPAEFDARVNNVYEQMVVQSEAIRSYYSTNFGFDMTTEAIVASVLDPDVGDSIINRRIAISQVGGEAASRNFTVATDLAERLVNYGTDTLGEAQQLFAEAEDLIPTIRVLAQRHADPNDAFDITEFTNAAVFGDPAERSRMRRLLAQERASFGPDQGLVMARDQGGALTGLRDL